MLSGTVTNPDGLLDPKLPMNQHFSANFETSDTILKTADCKVKDKSWVKNVDKNQELYELQ